VCGNDRGAPGADHVDWPGFLAALAGSGCAGPLCMESVTAENATIATAASIWRENATIATAASIWRPLASSQDDRDGRPGLPARADRHVGQSDHVVGEHAERPQS
jgi:hypothetical protein